MEVSGYLHAAAGLHPGKEPCTYAQSAGLTPEPVWTFWRREISLVPTGIRTPDCSAYSLVSISIALPWLLIKYY
jgi:hypothetical protein